MSGPYAIEANHLSKVYPGKQGAYVAVQDLSFSVAPGEAVAFLGPNGAGKSTTIKMLCGILAPSSGASAILGHEAGSKSANLALGLVFGTRSQLFFHMTVEQSLDLIAEIYYVTGESKRRRIADLAGIFEAGSLLGKRVRTLSLGERMRCELIAALVHRPAVLLADEPTIGLDIVAKSKLRELVRRWRREEKATLLLTSHDLSDVEALCERAILIDHGTKRYDGPLSELKGPLEKVRRIEATLDAAGVGEGGRVVTEEVDLGRETVAAVVSRLLEKHGTALLDLQISEVSLEEVLRERFARR